MIALGFYCVFVFSQALIIFANLMYGFSMTSTSLVEINGSYINGECEFGRCNMDFLSYFI